MCTVIVKNKWLCGVGYWKIIIIIIIIIIGFVVCVQWWLENIGKKKIQVHVGVLG